MGHNNVISLINPEPQTRCSTFWEGEMGGLLSRTEDGYLFL